MSFSPQSPPQTHKASWTACEGNTRPGQGLVLRLEISCVVRGRGLERLEDPDPTPDAAHSPTGPSLWLVPGA